MWNSYLGLAGRAFFLPSPSPPFAVTVFSLPQWGIMICHRRTPLWYMCGYMHTSTLSFSRSRLLFFRPSVCAHMTRVHASRNYWVSSSLPFSFPSGDFSEFCFPFPYEWKWRRPSSSCPNFDLCITFPGLDNSPLSVFIGDEYFTGEQDRCLRDWDRVKKKQHNHLLRFKCDFSLSLWVFVGRQRHRKTRWWFSFSLSLSLSLSTWGDEKKERDDFRLSLSRRQLKWAQEFFPPLLSFVSAVRQPEMLTLESFLLIAHCRWEKGISTL